MSRLAPRSSHGLVSQAELRRHLVLAAGSAPLSTPSSAGSPAPCLPVSPRNRGCEPVVLLHNSFHPIQGFSPPASGS